MVKKINTPLTLCPGSVLLSNNFLIEFLNFLLTNQRRRQMKFKMKRITNLITFFLRHDDKKTLNLRRIRNLRLLSLLQAQTPGHRPYRQFYANPYLFNPAYVGINNQTELNLSYRQQWIGFKDAPVITGLNLQFPRTIG